MAKDTIAASRPSGKVLRLLEALAKQVRKAARG